LPSTARSFETTVARDERTPLRDPKISARDRARVRELCCETGYLGNPIDPVFEDRELFADYLTAYYTDWEPESAFVLTVDGEIRGYLLGSRRPFRQQAYNFYQNASLFLRGILRYPRYSAASKKFVNGSSAPPGAKCPPRRGRTAHFHINLLADARQLVTTRAIMNAYLAYLHACGEKAVYGQMVVFEDRRSVKMFERYGFRVLNRAEITKYRDVHSEPVYLCTVIKDLDESSQIYQKAS
jgi:hypothetical protein